jgi:hypothetical protein
VGVGIVAAKAGDNQYADGSDYYNYHLSSKEKGGEEDRSENYADNYNDYRA